MVVIDSSKDESHPGDETRKEKARKLQHIKCQGRKVEEEKAEEEDDKKKKRLHLG